MTDNFDIRSLFSSKDISVINSAVKRSNLPEDVVIAPISNYKGITRDFVVVSTTGYRLNEFLEAYRAGALKVVSFTADIEEMVRRLDI